jgi:menaquinone-dependent protoporphyrinogen IX oxidase
MTVGIIVYSHTGHTLIVARRLEQRLAEAGHAVSLDELTIAGPATPSATNAMLKNEPSIEPYDTLVFATPVNGGRMSTAMNRYLDHIPSLRGKRVLCLVTHFLFHGWGADQTLEQMTELCRSKDATVCRAGRLRWSSFRRRRRITQVVENLARCLES